jgi:Flp pilus assembly protein TadD
MSRLLALLSPLVLLSGGCNKPASAAAATDDLPRLEAIDIRFQKGEVERALQELQKYTVEYPESGGAWSLLGWIHLKKEDLGNADRYFDKALEVDPNWDNAYVGKGAIYRRQGDNDRARKSYLQAIRLKPENAEAYSSMLVIEMVEGNYEKAVEYGERGWSLRKDLPSIPSNLSVAYHYTGDIGKRQYYYDQAKALGYPQLDVLVEIFRGERVVGPGRKENAREEEN